MTSTQHTTESAPLSLSNPISLSRKTLAEQVAAQMRKDIVSGAYQAGERLPSERERCAALNVSRTVLREAQSQLIRAGYLEVRRGKGTYIRPRSRVREQRMHQWVTEHDNHIAQLLDMRSVLEPGIAQLASAHASEQDHKTLQASVDQLRNSDSLECAVKADEDFHIHLAKVTNNSLVLQLMEYITTQIPGGERHITLRTPEGIQAAADDHQRILDAICRKDGQAASHTMLLHIENARAYSKRLST